MIVAVIGGFAVSYYTPTETYESKGNWGGQPCYFVEEIKILNNTITIIRDSCNV